jgi:hypothetical protein
MKPRFTYIVAVLVLSMVASAITGEHWVKFVNSLTNDNGVKIIVVQGNGGHPSYTLACNDGEQDCVTPDAGVWYTLKASPNGKYTNGENVVLTLKAQTVGNYFLIASAE